MTLAEYEQSVGPLNKYYHETAEEIVLVKENVLPLDPDQDEPGDDSPGADEREPLQRPT